MSASIAPIFLVLFFKGFFVWSQTPQNKIPEANPMQPVSSQQPVQSNSAMPDLNPVPQLTAPQAASFPSLPRRDPFRIPDYIILKVKQKAAESASVLRIGEIEDLNATPIRRWSLLSYQLVGIIWDVKKPKAMFVDRQGQMHVLQLNDFIGNQKGIITDIQSGVVTVLEGKLQQFIKLKK